MDQQETKNNYKEETYSSNDPEPTKKFSIPLLVLLVAGGILLAGIAWGGYVFFIKKTNEEIIIESALNTFSAESLESQVEADIEAGEKFGFNLMLGGAGKNPEKEKDTLKAYLDFGIEAFLKQDMFSLDLDTEGEARFIDDKLYFVFNEAPQVLFLNFDFLEDRWIRKDIAEEDNDNINNMLKKFSAPVSVDSEKDFTEIIREEGVPILKIAQESEFLLFKDKKDNELNGTSVTEFVLVINEEKADVFLNSFADAYEGQITEKFGENFPSAEKIREKAEEIDDKLKEEDIKIKDNNIFVNYFVDEDAMELRRIEVGFDFEPKEDMASGLFKDIEEGSFSLAFNYNKIGEPVSVEAPEESESLEAVIMEVMGEMGNTGEAGKDFFSSFGAKEKDKTIEKDTEEKEGSISTDEKCEIGQKAKGGVVAQCSDEGEPTFVVTEKDVSEGVKWGCKGEELGVSSKFAGEYNTERIVQGCPNEDSAAGLCAELNKGDYKDWYLPSRKELDLLYDRFSKNNLRNFSKDFYWASSEESKEKSYSQNFENGSQHKADKDYENKVRCLRKIKEDKNKETQIDSSISEDTPKEKPSDEISGDCEPGQERGGGIVASCAEDGEPELIVMKEDISDRSQWGCEGEEIGADSESNGQQNTQQIIGSCQEEGIAARLCAESTEGGYDDWYLPAEDKWFDIGEDPPLYEGLYKEGLGEFLVDEWYWTSTELSGNKAKAYKFENTGSSGIVGIGKSRDSNFRVRCVRSY